MSDQAEEVRFEYLRPFQIRARREKADIAMLPLGTLEWHGYQNPVGLDSLKAHHICCEVVRQLDGGGVVFPTVTWGVPRDSFHVDTSMAERTDKLAIAYGTDGQTLRASGSHGGVDRQEQWLSYQRLLRTCMEQVAAFGFRSIYLLAGHYPLVHFARPACLAFTRSTQMEGCVVTTDWGRENDALDMGGDHGGKWETSLMMAAAEQTVDLGELEANPEGVGLGCGANAVESTLEQGREWTNQCVDAITEEVRWMIDNYPAVPKRHAHFR